MRWILALLLASPAFFPQPAAADGFALQEGDAPFAREAMISRLSGEILTFYDNGKSRYYADGRYSYTYDGDVRESAGGYWQVREDGVVCVEFITGHARCDQYVQNGARLILLDQKGDRYPVRPQP